MTTPLGRTRFNPLSHQIPHSLQTNHFRNELQQFASKDISQEDYLANCRSIVAQLLNSPEYSFYKMGIKKAEPMLDLFKETTSEASFVTKIEMDNINNQFQTLFCDTLSEKLATDAGQAFYPIPLLALRDEKIHSAQNWTALFFEHLHTLSNLQNCHPFDDLLVEKLRNMTLDQLKDHAHSIRLQSFRKMIAQMESDPASFQATLKRVLQKDPGSLSIAEKEYVNFTQIYNDYAMRQFPDIEKKANLMRQCITLGHDLQKNEIPILESWDAFARTLKE